jgi:integration host factor subunit alpha
MSNKKENDVLTKRDLVRHLMEKKNYTFLDAHKHVDGFIQTFQELISEGNHLKMSYFGDFVLQDKTPRPGRNPRTGKDFTITARRVLKFHPANKLKKIVLNL